MIFINVYVLIILYKKNEKGFNNTLLYVLECFFNKRNNIEK